MSCQIISTYCPLCISRCGALATVENGVLTALERDPGHPTGGGFCIKGRAAPELVYSPQRLTQPLRRIGPRGSEARWEAVSWEEALDAIAAKMAAIRSEAGAQAMVFGVTTPSGTAIADSFGWIHRLARSYGSPNVLFATDNCNWHKEWSPHLTFGSGLGMPDLDHCGCLLLWGANPSVSWIALAQEIKQAQRRGMKLIVIDPRRDGLARNADLWLRVRPGSDKALALTLAGELLRLGAVDDEFLRQWSNAPWLVRSDNQQLLQRDGAALVWNGVTHSAELATTSTDSTQWALRGRYAVATPEGTVECRPAFDLYAEQCELASPERTAPLTGIAPEQLRAAAKLIATSGPLALNTWTGLCQHADATQTTRAISLLYALSGDWDGPGGNVAFKRPPFKDIAGAELLPSAVRNTTLGMAQRPLGPPGRGWLSVRELSEALAAPQPSVRGVFAFGGNWLATKPLADEFVALLDRLELFVMTEMFLTPTAQLADWVLPAASPFEREGLCPSFGISQQAESRLQLRPALVAAQGKSRSDNWIIFELAHRLGLADHFFGGDMEAALHYQLSATGITPQQLRSSAGGVDLGLTTDYRKYLTSGFATPSGRVEFFSTQLQQHGHAPVPILSEPQTVAEYPLLLVSVKVAANCHSQHRQLPSLRRHAPQPTVLLHPELVARVQAAEGDWLAVVTPRGRIAAQVQLDKDLAPDVVVSSYGWLEASLQELQERLPHGVGLNFATLAAPEVCDPVSGSNELKALPCRLERIELTNG